MNTIQKKGKSKAPKMTLGNVFEDLGFSKEESALLAFKTDIHSLILRKIKEKGHTRRGLEHVFNEPQPRISELMTGKISKMSLEKLISYFYLLGETPRLILVSNRGNEIRKKKLKKKLA